MFFNAPMHVIHSDENGNVSYSNLIEPEDGYTSIESMHKNVIQSPFDFTTNIPTSGKKAMEFGLFVETKQDFDSMTAGLCLGRR